MTPQERQLVTELFDRLATLENAPRDADAERTIADGLARAPHATYALVQTALVQDEALKRANARIQELEGQPAEEPSRGFLDNMRDSLFGREEPPRGSVPRAGGLGSSGVWGQPGGAPQGGPSGMNQMGPAPGGMGPGMGQGMGPGYNPGVGTGGGSFLGTAAASAAGVLGGAMLLNGIRSMFGQSHGGASAFDRDAAGGSPWGGGGSAANSDLARDAGVDHVGGDRGFDHGGDSNHASLFGDDQDDDARFGDEDETDYAGDFDGDDSDTA